MLWSADEPFTDLRELIADAPGGVTVLCWSGTVYRIDVPGGRYLRHPGPVAYTRGGDFTVEPLGSLDVATGCGLVISGVAGGDDWVASTRVVAVVDGFDATQVPQRIADLFLSSPAERPLAGHPAGSCGARGCANR